MQMQRGGARVIVCPNGADPDFKHLRLIGNR